MGKANIRIMLSDIQAAWVEEQTATAIQFGSDEGRTARSVKEAIDLGRRLREANSATRKGAAVFGATSDPSECAHVATVGSSCCVKCGLQKTRWAPRGTYEKRGSAVRGGSSE